MIAVFHHINSQGNNSFVHSIEDILAFDGQITFDGAYTSVYEHRESLAPRRPLLFIQGETIANGGVCTWAQIKELEDLGFILGWHGWTHRRLTELSEAEIRLELQPAFSTKLYAYPHGDFNQQSIDIIQQMGYEKAYSTTQGNEDNFSIKRIYV